MGKRAWYFRCEECGEEFGKCFEHMDKEDCANWIDELNCNECNSDNIVFTGETAFSGVHTYDNDGLVFFCVRCGSPRYIDVSEINVEVVKYKITDLKCMECDSDEFSLSDTSKKDWKEVEGNAKTL
jgi:hypothetical protein